MQLFPDLVISLFDETSITVTNKGLVTAAASTAAVLVFGDPFLFEDVPALGPGEEFTFSYTGCRPGLTLGGYADFYGVVDEADENNSQTFVCP